MVGEGQRERCVLRGTTGFSRLDVGRCDVGDPRVFGWEGGVRRVKRL